MIFLLLCSSAFAIRLVGTTPNGTMILSTESYVAKINPEQNIFTINNVLPLFIFPKNKVLGVKAEPMEPMFGNIQPGEEVNEYIVTYPQSVAKDVYISSSLRLEDKYVYHEITIENTQGSELEIYLRLSQQDNRTYYVFAPFMNNPLMNYLWVSPSYNQEKGQGLAIYFDTDTPTYFQVGEITQSNESKKFLQWRIKVGAGEIKKVIVKYIPGYVSDLTLLKSHPFGPPATKQHLLDIETDPIFILRNKEALNSMIQRATGKSAKEVIENTKAILNEILNTPTADTGTLTDDANFQDLVSKQQLDSLEKSLMFREIVRSKGIPAALKIGFDGARYYAWVEIYPTVEPLVYDPAGKRKQYKVIYSEPTPFYCAPPVTNCNWINNIRTDVVCIMNFCSSVYILSFLVLLAIAATFLILQYKAELIYKLSNMRRVGGDKSDVDGNYTIVDEDYVPADPLEESVLKEMRNSLGVIKLKDYEKKTGFSELLIAAAVKRLEEKGVIKRT